jgi:hypothetical protein
VHVNVRNVGVGRVGVSHTVYIRERGGGGRGGSGLRRTISDVIHTHLRQSRGLGQTLSVGVAISDAPVYMRE